MTQRKWELIALHFITETVCTVSDDQDQMYGTLLKWRFQELTFTSCKDYKAFQLSGIVRKPFC